MREQRYSRPEFQQELEAASRGYDDERQKAARKRLTAWYDDIMYDLGQVSALRTALDRATNEKVDAEVRANEAEAMIRSLEKQLSAKRVKEEEDDE